MTQGDEEPKLTLEVQKSDDKVDSNQESQDKEKSDHEIRQQWLEEAQVHPPERDPFQEEEPSTNNRFGTAAFIGTQGAASDEL